MGDHILAQTLSNTVSDVTLGETVLAHPVKSGDNPLARKTCFLEVTESGSTENSADVKVPVHSRPGWSIAHVRNCNLCARAGMVSGLDLLIDIHEKVYAHGLPNFAGARVSVPSLLNLSFWRSELSEYADKMIVDFLEFGWPINILVPEMALHRGVKPRNHTGVKEFPLAVESYLRAELSHKAVLGPFKVNPFSHELVYSPLNTVPKGVDRRRVILDLSWPKDNSVNSFIDKHTYLGEESVLSLPRVDRLVTIVCNKGPGCLLFKRDLKRAFRQLPVDPADWGFLAYHFQSHIFIDMVLPNGLRSAVLCCQRTTSAVVFMFQQRGFDAINYIDDLGGADTPVRAGEAYDCLGEILRLCGLAEAAEKAEPPATRMIFLGVLVDSEKMTLEVGQDRLKELDTLLEQWLSWVTVTKQVLQSLIGKLNFVATCVRSSRIFFSRLLNFLRAMDGDGPCKVTEQVCKDIVWWKTFLPHYNGVSLIIQGEWGKPDVILASDACLSGCGGVMGDQIFRSKFPNGILDLELHINALELLTIIVALKLWADKLRNRRFQLYCDNMTSVVVINSGKSRDSFLQACLREICYIASVNNFEVRAVHIAGAENRVPDLLSRWHTHPRFELEFNALMGSRQFYQRRVGEELFFFQHDW